MTDKWQPIASAPDDGTLFDAWSGSKGIRVTDCWSEAGQFWAYREGGGFAPVEGLTHWRPLPEQPVAPIDDHARLTDRFNQIAHRDDWRYPVTATVTAEQLADTISAIHHVTRSPTTIQRSGEGFKLFAPGYFVTGSSDER